MGTGAKSGKLFDRGREGSPGSSKSGNTSIGSWSNQEHKHQFSETPERARARTYKLSLLLRPSRSMDWTRSMGVMTKNSKMWQRMPHDRDMSGQFRRNYSRDTVQKIRRQCRLSFCQRKKQRTKRVLYTESLGPQKSLRQ